MDRTTAPFMIGDEVVSLKTFRKGEDLLEVPKKDQRLTVRTIEFDTNYGGFWVLRFFEIKNPPRDYIQGFIEARFAAKWFRKINPYQSSVSRELAEKALDTVKDNQDVVPVRKEVEVDN